MCWIIVKVRYRIRCFPISADICKQQQSAVKLFHYGKPMTRHFLSLRDLSRQELLQLINRATELKSMLRRGVDYEPMRNQTLAMMFEKSSTRTRLSFEVAATQFGGNAIFMSPGDSQMGRGEPIADTARVMSSMVDIIVLRTFSHSTIEEMANFSAVPVINGLSDRFHPCQLLADIQTFHEARGSIQGKTVTWIGDGNNMCHSWINASQLLDFTLNIATPAGYTPAADLVNNTQNVYLNNDPLEAATNADLIMTDTWASMGQENEKNSRAHDFKDFKVTMKIMERGQSDCVFMHCLPAYREMEVETQVIDGQQSLIWQQAENRLHAQKALIEFLLLN